ncbi:MAG: hypothetical protein R3B67_04425 [Phycisphaerales bacterium]
MPVGRIQFDGEGMLFLVGSFAFALNQTQAQVNGRLVDDGDIQARMGSGFEQVSPAGAFDNVNNNVNEPKRDRELQRNLNSGTSQYEITIEGESFSSATTP